MCDKTDSNPAGPASFMKSWRTLTGLTIEQAVYRLMDVLPPRAYKAVPGAAGLTDIDPSYLTQVVTGVFGLCGLGWKYEYDPCSLDVTCREETTKAGNQRTVYDALLSLLTVQFRFTDDAGNILWSEPIPANGGSENDQRGFAVRGALTNAIGAAFAKLCWQLPVYQGRIDHRNAAEMYKKAHQGKAGDNGGSNGNQAAEKKGEQGSDKSDEQRNDNNGAQRREQYVPDLANTPPEEWVPEQPQAESHQKPSGKLPVISPERLSRADSIVIPEGIGVPLAGETLGAAKKDKMFGAAILKYLSGKYANASGEHFKPANPAQEILQQAATLLLEAEGVNGNGIK